LLLLDIESREDREDNNNCDLRLAAPMGPAALGGSCGLMELPRALSERVFRSKFMNRASRCVPWMPLR